MWTAVYNIAPDDLSSLGLNSTCTTGGPALAQGLPGSAIDETGQVIPNQRLPNIKTNSFAVLPTASSPYVPGQCVTPSGPVNGIYRSYRVRTRQYCWVMFLNVSRSSVTGACFRPSIRICPPTTAAARCRPRRQCLTASPSSLLLPFPNPPAKLSILALVPLTNKTSLTSCFGVDRLQQGLVFYIFIYLFFLFICFSALLALATRSSWPSAMLTTALPRFGRRRPLARRRWTLPSCLAAPTSPPTCAPTRRPMPFRTPTRRLSTRARRASPTTSDSPSFSTARTPHPNRVCDNGRVSLFFYF